MRASVKHFEPNSARATCTFVLSVKYW